MKFITIIDGVRWGNLICCNIFLRIKLVNCENSGKIKRNVQTGDKKFLILNCLENGFLEVKMLEKMWVLLYEIEIWYFLWMWSSTSSFLSFLYWSLTFILVLMRSLVIWETVNCVEFLKENFTFSSQIFFITIQSIKIWIVAGWRSL